MEQALTDTILITGGTGFLGRFLARKLTARGARVVLGARNNEQNRLAIHLTGCDAKPLDVTNIESLRDVVREVRPKVIIHAAATKYVDLSEREPMECVDVNVLGSQNVARVAIDAGVEKVLAISTDKAAPPVDTIYGVTKALMERMICAMDGKTETKFASVRFGNIAWSTGSVFPLWKEMQQGGGIIRSTGPHMRRYFFTVHDAVALVEAALDNFESISGCVLTCDMGAAQISDILDVWTRVHGGAWEQVSERQGDSLDQWLIGPSEVEHARTVQLDGGDYYLLDFRQKASSAIGAAMSSASARRLTHEEIVALIHEPDEKQG